MEEAASDCSASGAGLLPKTLRAGSEDECDSSGATNRARAVAPSPPPAPDGAFPLLSHGIVDG
jgi:hypothetical protein